MVENESYKQILLIEKIAEISKPSLKDLIDQKLDGKPQKLIDLVKKWQIMKILYIKTF